MGAAAGITMMHWGLSRPRTGAATALMLNVNPDGGVADNGVAPSVIAGGAYAGELQIIGRFC